MGLSTFVLTDAGNELLARAQTGETLTITRAQAGEGTWLSSTTHANITQLASPVTDLPIVSKTQSKGLVKITVQFTNQGVDRDFLWSEFGLWAADPDYPDDRSHDILYGTAYADGTPVPIESALTEFLFNVLIKTGSAESVTVVVDSSLVYMSRADAEALIKQETKGYITEVEAGQLIEEALKNQANVIIKNITISKTAWTKGDTRTAYGYYAEAYVQEAVAAHFPVAAIHEDALDVASAAGMAPTMQAMKSKVRFSAQTPANVDIDVTLALISGMKGFIGDGIGIVNIGNSLRVNVPGGVAGLDEDGKILPSVLPDDADGGFVMYVGQFPAQSKQHTLYGEVVADYEQ